MDTPNLVKCARHKYSQTIPKRVQIQPCFTGQDASTQVRTRPIRPEANAAQMELPMSICKELREQCDMLNKLITEIKAMHAEYRSNSGQLIDLVTETTGKIEQMELHANKARIFSAPEPSTSNQRMNNVHYDLKPDSRTTTSTNNDRFSPFNSTIPEVKLSIMDELSDYAFRHNLSTQFGHTGCPEMCPSCGNTIKCLMAEISELRKTRELMLRIRDEANVVLDTVIIDALDQARHGAMLKPRAKTEVIRMDSDMLQYDD